MLCDEQRRNSLVSRRTFFSNIAVAGNVIQVLLKNSQRTGFVLCNRSATIVFVGTSPDITAIPSGTVVRLLQNEILTVLKSEFDDPTNQLFAIASGASVVEIVESTEV